ncbi:HNH endonuclease signature motif containing protein [Massilia sp.]|uniref:HNH endonuclease n=1 Tax=Massilia sp. TaxID=1882437 RepID=UPI0028989D5A|nr:HNH endonuclease signature motif containing protein [Massilia sp.]
MPIFNIQITWQYSIESIVLDTTSQPTLGKLLTTTEHRIGEDDEHTYEAVILNYSHTDQSMLLTLDYDKFRNQEVSNDSWGKSTIEIDLSKKALHRAVWKDNEINNYNGPARNVVLTIYPTEVEKLTAELVNDIAVIEGSIADTERPTQILARVGQGKFRAGVTHAWKNGEACAVTGIAVPELLIASHIRAWKDSDDNQRLDPANGLLLAAHVDKLFDRHLLSFEKTKDGYVIRFNLRIKKIALDLGIKADARLPIENLDEIQRDKFEAHMGYHFLLFSQKSAQESDNEATW